MGRKSDQSDRDEDGAARIVVSGLRLDPMAREFAEGQHGPDAEVWIGDTPGGEVRCVVVHRPFAYDLAWTVRIYRATERDLSIGIHWQLLETAVGGTLRGAAAALGAQVRDRVHQLRALRAMRGFARLRRIAKKAAA